ncbi:MAG: glycerophosphodiester phosphodiesterase [Clostridiales bacterium]|nr:glycerophosphodiester phosphodiesterase [Clostridiales bacterium]
MLLNVIILILILVLLYLLIIMPKLSKNPRLDNFDGWFYAHRGLHNNKSEAPENSLLSFKKAVEEGYGIELDVQITKDKVAVVHHDYDLKRSCGVDKKISDLEYEDLKEYRLFKSQERIPSLEEVLALVAGKVPLIVELKILWKPGDTCGAASKVLKRYDGLYCIESFNPFGLVWYKKHFPQIVRGQLSTDFNKEKIEGSKMQYFILKHLLFNFLTKPDFIAYHHKYKKGLSFNICRRLYKTKTAAWTIKSQNVFNDNKEDFDWFIFEGFHPENQA